MAEGEHLYGPYAQTDARSEHSKQRQQPSDDPINALVGIVAAIKADVDQLKKDPGLVGHDGIKVAGKIIGLDGPNNGQQFGAGNKGQLISVNLIVQGIQESHDFYEAGETP